MTPMHTCAPDSISKHLIVHLWIPSLNPASLEITSEYPFPLFVAFVPSSLFFTYGRFYVEGPVEFGTVHVTLLWIFPDDYISNETFWFIYGLLRLKQRLKSAVYFLQI